MKCSLDIFCLNIRSLRRNYDSLTIYLNGLVRQYKIIVLTEVWIKDGEEDRYQLQGYDTLLQPRSDNKAGGVVIYVDSDLHYTRRLVSLQTAEVINVVFEVTNSSLTYNISLYGIYRNCKYSFFSFKNEFETILQQSADPTIIIGDMNICTLHTRGSGEEYLNTIAAYGFESKINVATRVTDRSSSCLDHVLIRNSKHFQFESEVIELDITDHYALQVSISNCIRTENKIKYCKIIDYEMLKRQLLLADWSPVIDNYEINMCVSQFYKIYNDCVLSSCYLKKLNSKVRKRNEWISNELIQIVNNKNKAFNEFKKNRNNVTLKNEYNRLAVIVKKRIRKEKLTYYSDLVRNCCGDSKKYWNVIRKIVRSKNPKLDVININGLMVNVENNEYAVANHFNEYFSNVVSNLKFDEFGSDMFFEEDVHYDILKSEFIINRDDIENCIRTMKNKKSSGVDGISILTIKNNLAVFVPLLHDIFVKSLQQGIVPTQFKTACVVPIYKSGSAAEVSSYRPISVISTIAKIFESVVKNNIMNYFTITNFFSNNQYGFLPDKGTDIAIYNHITDISKSVDSHKYTLAVYLDFQKAFDVLDINILIRKFKKCGLGGRALQWLQSFVNDRRQVVKVNGVTGDVRGLRHGTAQGGVLGPIVFLIYINDLLNIEFNSSVYAYADDTALVCSAYNRELLKRRINEDLSKISKWLIENKLLINSSKSKCVMFFDLADTKQSLQARFDLICHKHKCLYQCNCCNIEVVDHVKYLGLYIDKNLKWDHQAYYLNKKLRKINYSIYYLRKFIKNEYLKNIYTSWFESTMRYGIIHYGGTYPTIMRPIIMCQRHAVRNVFGVRRTHPVTHIFHNNNILNFNQIYLYSLLLFIYKYKNCFQLHQASRVTRSMHYTRIQLLNFVKEKCRNQCCYVGPREFNKLILHYGNELMFERKPKFKMKLRQYVRM